MDNDEMEDEYKNDYDKNLGIDDFTLGCFGSTLIGGLIIYLSFQLIEILGIDNIYIWVSYGLVLLLDIIAVVYFRKYTNRKSIGTGALIPLLLILIPFIVVGGCIFLVDGGRF